MITVIEEFIYIAMGILVGNNLGTGVVCWSGLKRLDGSQYSIWLISLARSVTISDTAHHAGGFGEPPKVSLMATNAALSMAEMVCAAALGSWAMRRYASE